ncbi:hypothetical protein PCANC_03227 [Puccinia coronata f. sp. avenae]|uniref:Uncharacterized protein n=1 Tax=Puccinia coronata f. sp. avenae TaxID=200324 RepID=A0A2N5VZ24_9BASI|nr:hypothetical protein PCANC_03227 [Puccinia coronata f. sp. avenae]
MNPCVFMTAPIVPITCASATPPETGLDSGTPKGRAHAPPNAYKKGVRGLHAFPHRRANPPSPHAAHRPHAYKWREDGRLGVRPRRTGVLAMHACLEGVQALHALRTGVHGWHACPARLT